MKRILLLTTSLFIGIFSFAQTNTFPSSGNAGIGTTSPNVKLHVKGDGTANDIISADDGGISIKGGNSTAHALRFDDTGGVDRHLVYINQSNNVMIGNPNFNKLYFSDQDVVFSNSNVGIGTTAPEELLHVHEGNVKFEFDSQFGNDPIVMFENEGTNADVRQSFYRWSGNSDLYWGTRFEREASSGFKIQMAGTSTLGSHSFVDALTILNNGNIGIGTTTTGSHKLAVEGSIGAREVKVEASGWSDFVFEKDYELRPLEEVEEYITENHHLPEIPSEAEVTEKGINLGEMNAKLLQKIEELTLYLIEQNKRMNNLETRNAALEKEISNLKQ